MRFSVLLSVYKKEKPEYLKVALESIINQSLMPDEIVIVKDGALTNELDSVIESFQKKHIGLFKIMAFEKNRGLGLALRDGVLACSNEWIARMDTDDIAYPFRFEKQFQFLKDHPDISMVGSWITEFSTVPEQPDTITKLPVEYEDIVSYAKSRNPFRHMTLVYKKEAIVESGNYRDFLWFEDYDMWVRMIQHGYKVVNLPEVLVNVRADDGMFARRGGWKYLKNDLLFQKQLKDTGFINWFQYSKNVILRVTMRIIPNKLRLQIYKHFLRSNV